MLFSTHPETYTSLPETAIPPVVAQSEPLGKGNAETVVVVPLFTQYAALAAVYPATYTSLPETAIAVAVHSAGQPGG